MATPKEERFKAAKVLIESGHIKSWSEIFLHIPKSLVGAELGFNGERISKLVADPSDMRIKDLKAIAEIIGCKEETLFSLVNEASTPLKRSK